MQLHTEEGCERVGRSNLLQGLLGSLGVVCQLADTPLQVQQLLRGAVHFPFNSLQLP